MISIDEVKKYLPQYLSAASQKELYSELRSFPENIDKRLYSNSHLDQSHIYQGDGIKDLLFVNLPEQEFGRRPGVILSNTCDLDISNRRFKDIRVLYAPILKLESYKKMLLTKLHSETKKIHQHIDAIRNQYISDIFYLPCGQGLDYEGMVTLDRVNNCSRNAVSGEFIEKNRLFSLSNYGFYLFLLKISIHLTRVREGVDRNTYSIN